MATAEGQTKKKLPLLARLGRSVGESNARSREARQQLAATSEASRQQSREQFTGAIDAFKGGVRKLTEGFRAGSEGRPVDTAAFNPGEGTTDSTPRPPDEIVVSDRQPASDPFTPEIDVPAPTLANAGREAMPQAAQQPAAQQPARTPVERPDFNRTGDLKDLPEGFVQIIKGTELGFSDAAGNQFKSVPGLSPEESRDVAARRDPAFNVRTQEDLERGRINAQTINAEANRLNAQGNNRFQGIDPETGQFGIFTMDENGQVQPTGVSPIVDEIVNGGEEFSVETVMVPSDIPGVADERQIRLNRQDGTFIDITKSIREEIGAEKFRVLQEQNPDADVQDLIEQAEAQSGGPLPQIRDAYSEQ